MTAVSEFLGYFDFWQLLAGLGLFLFGMMQAEEALAGLAGGGLKRALRRYTSHHGSAIATGIVATGLVQSSSVVGLMTLAFVGAGVIQLANALGVIIGANLGTTMTGWIVTTLGFKLDIGRAAMVLIAIGSIALIASDEGSRVRRWGRLGTGFGLIFFGLGLMKDSFLAGDDSVRRLVLSGGHPLVYVAIGFALTAIIQSSSAMMMVTLSVLHAGLIGLTEAAAVVIGADLGSTITVLIGGLRGELEKRRVAYAHVLFNVVTTVLALVLLLPLLPWLLAWAGIVDPLYGVVAFHSAFNVVGILLFYPFLDRFAGLLRRLVPDRREQLAVGLTPEASQVPEAGLEAIEREVDRLTEWVLAHVRQVLMADANSGGVSRAYGQLKRLETELIEFSLRLEQQSLSEDESRRLRSLQTAARNLVLAAKAVKDIHHNLREMAESANLAQEALLAAFADHFRPLLAGIEQARSGGAGAEAQLEELDRLNRTGHEALHRLALRTAAEDGLDEPLHSSLLNVNRELYTAGRELIGAMAARWQSATVAG